MADQVAFLTAAWARAEEIAKAASRDGATNWQTAEHPSDTRAVIDDHGEAVVYNEGWPTEEQAAHIARHDPAAVLRRVTAERQILAEHTDHGWGSCRLCADPCEPRTAVDWPCRTVVLLAQAWGWDGG